MADDAAATAVERAVLGFESRSQVFEVFDHYLEERLGSRIRIVRFRSGRIDAVWGVQLADGRAVVVKAHRPPARLKDIRVAFTAQRLLVASGFPAAEPLAGPDTVDRHVLTVENLLSGRTPDGRLPAVRERIAAGLAEHIDLLRGHAGLRSGIGPGPSWWRYQAGPWPRSHDSLVDLQHPVPGYEWLDRYAAGAAELILANRDEDRVVIAHADWYAGNLHVQNGRLTGVFDWELVADDEAVIAGFAAAGFAGASSTSAGMSTPEQAAAFLQDYDSARGHTFTPRQRRAAAGGAAWILAFDTRFQVVILPAPEANLDAIANLSERGQDYLDLGR